MALLKIKLKEVGGIVSQEAQGIQAVRIQVILLVSRCTNFRKMKKFGRSGSSLFRSIGRDSETQEVGFPLFRSLQR